MTTHRPPRDVDVLHTRRRDKHLQATRNGMHIRYRRRVVLRELCGHLRVRIELVGHNHIS